ncbi:MAG: hypothetical protein J1E16_05675 [Muribaculaceae bacterium]|nr:hypothetical protein [Muribaculaceae bacterium]
MVIIRNKPSGTIFSSSLSELIISSDNDYVELSLRTVGDEITLYKENLWVYNGSAIAYNLSDIIENYMREKGISMLWLQITAQYLDQHDVASVHIVYCDAMLESADDVSVFLSNNFLTRLNTKRVDPDSKFSLYFYSSASDREMYELEYYFFIEGVEDKKSITIRGYVDDESENIYSIGINMADLRRSAALAFHVDSSLISISSFSVRCGERSMDFFIDKSLQYGQAFFFRNIFNAWDFIIVPALTSESTEVEHSLADVGSKSVSYDRNVSKSYEVLTGPIDTDEAKLIADMVASHEICRIIKDVSYPVLITDSECIIKDGEVLQTAKFSWRYAVNRVVMN